jgi:hypothetical protein
MLALCGLWASAAAAQAPAADPGPEQQDRPGPRAPARLFISPSGEPFRDGDGLAGWFAGADRDRDTLLTRPEFEADAERFFAVLDGDGDGVVDGFENQAYERQIAPEITRLGETPRPGARPDAEGERPRRSLLGFGRGKPEPGVQRQGAGRYGLLNEPQPVRGADGDLSGRVSRIEWRAAAARRFDLLDLDGDGVLTLDTLPPLAGARPPR